MSCHPVTFLKRGSISAISICTGLLGILSAPLLGADSPQEFERKAVCLYNFTRFVEWPKRAFESGESPLTIGILGSDAFGDRLKDTVKGECVRGRWIKVVQCSTVAEINGCHLLFIGETEGAPTHEIISALRLRPILTVCDWARPGADAAMIRFAVDQGRMRLLVNLEAAKAAGLAVSSKLLRAAETVLGPETQP